VFLALLLLVREVVVEVFLLEVQDTKIEVVFLQK
jgi:hypothetical protein